MREFTKSMCSFSWAMSLFGAQQMANLFSRPDQNRPRHKATGAFDQVTHATEDQLGDILRETFKAGDRLQRGLVDMMFGSFLTQGLNPSQAMDVATEAMDRTAEAMGRTAGAVDRTTGCCGRRRARDWDDTGSDAGGWGPMPA